jgi:hypothetical protein
MSSSAATPGVWPAIRFRRGAAGVGTPNAIHRVWEPLPLCASRMVGAIARFRPSSASGAPEIIRRPNAANSLPASHRKLGSFRTNGCCNGPTCPQADWLCFYCHLQTDYRLPATANWLRFASFAHRGLGPAPAGPNWVCFAQLGLFCRSSWWCQSIITLFPHSTCPFAPLRVNWVCFAQFAPAGIGFVLQNRSPADNCAEVGSVCAACPASLGDEPRQLGLFRTFGPRDG